MGAAMLLTLAGCNKPKECKCITTQTMPDMDPMVTESVMTAQDGKCDEQSVTQTITAPDGEKMSQTIKCE